MVFDLVEGLVGGIDQLGNSGERVFWGMRRDSNGCRYPYLFTRRNRVAYLAKCFQDAVKDFQRAGWWGLWQHNEKLFPSVSTHHITASDLCL